MATQWGILSIMTLVFSVASGGDQPLVWKGIVLTEEKLQALSCCDSVKVLPEIFKNEPDECFEGTEKGKEENKIAMSCTMIECVMSKNDMLNEDKSVKETMLRDEFLKKEMPSIVKSTLTEALDKCFKVYKTEEEEEDEEDKKEENEEIKKPTCKSQSGKLFSCIIRQVIFNCPPTLWETNKDGCGRKQGAEGHSEKAAQENTKTGTEKKTEEAEEVDSEEE